MFIRPVKGLSCEWTYPTQDGALGGGDTQHAVRVPPGPGGGGAAAAAAAEAQGLPRRRRWERRRG